MLTKTALKLYRLPRASQPLRRLPGQWSEPTVRDLPLPNQRKSAKSTLKWLAARAPARGARIEVFSLAPQEGPDRNGRVSFSPNGLNGFAALLPGAVTVY